MKAKIYLIINRYQRSRTTNRRPYVTLACERGAAVKKYTKPVVDNEEEEIPIKRRGPYGRKKYGCPFKLKGEQMATSENWQLFVHNGRQNHKITVYHHGHAQVARLTEEQLRQTEQFRKSHMPPHNILRFFREQDKIYNVVAKNKKNQMQGRHTVEEVLCLTAQRGYTVFYRNREESNLLSDIVVAHPTSIAMIRTWPYVLIMDTTYKTNKYNMPLLETVGMTPTGKNYIVATAFICNEQATTYRWVLQQIKHLYVTSAMSNGHSSIMSKDMGSEMRNLTSMLEEISTSPISKVQEVRLLIKGVICPVLPQDPCPPLTNPLETESQAVQGLGREAVQAQDPVRVHVEGVGHPVAVGVGAEDVTNVVGDGNCGFRVVSNFLFGDENDWAEIRRRMSYDLHYHMNVYVQLFGSLERVTELIRKTNWGEGSAPVDYWIDTPNHLYVIANTFNLCVVLIARFGSTIVLPLYSNMDCTAGILFIGFIAEQEHFIYLQL
ncbi:hypothetical protein M9H77_18986 [Catharanthus roseus]|uniref:Uncharacterized protein n=1 Tax=Catharanthus roseus TaxID=4058 RepID=A0ACC0B964_CATRO|nr:hypothetical protein M9H77_18986 [Catharanthus roseus]